MFARAVEVSGMTECTTTLLAGLQVIVGAWVLAANVRDELAGFAELSGDE